jgi:hypothetical protein
MKLTVKKLVLSINSVIILVTLAGCTTLSTSSTTRFIQPSTGWTKAQVIAANGSDCAKTTDGSSDIWVYNLTPKQKSNFFDGLAGMLTSNALGRALPYGGGLSSTANLFATKGVDLAVDGDPYNTSVAPTTQIVRFVNGRVVDGPLSTIHGSKRLTTRQEPVTMINEFKNPNASRNTTANTSPAVSTKKVYSVEGENEIHYPNNPACDALESKKAEKAVTQHASASEALNLGKVWCTKCKERDYVTSVY